MGYVGPILAFHLRKAYPNAVLSGVDIGYFGHCLAEAYSFPEKNLNIQYFQDVRYLNSALLDGVDIVIHLAAISNDPMGKAYEEVTNEINYESSVSLVQKAKNAGVKRFIFASSCSVYGYAAGSARDEKSELNPLTAYARSKIDTEHAIKDLATRNFVVTSLRFPTACGMSDRLRLDLVLNDFVASAVILKKISILSDGTPWRPLIDVKDMARAIDWAISRRVDHGEEFIAVNVGRTEWNYQVRDLAEAVKEIIKGIDININQNAQPDKRSYRVDFSLYKELAPDHQPQINIIQSIKELEQGIKRMKFDDGDFRNSNFMRLRVLTSLQDIGLLNNRLEWIN